MIRRVGVLVGLAVLLAGCGADPVETRPTPNVVIVVLDTVRSASLGLLESPEQSRVLSGLAQHGVVFEHASSTFDFTPPSHHSIFTGYHAGLGTEFDHPDNSLAAHLRRLGYLTIGISANGLLSPKTMNFCKPFEIFFSHSDDYEVNEDQILSTYGAEIADVEARYDIELTEGGLRNTLASADWVLKKLEEALPPEPSRPLLVFLNFMEAHDPYTPPEGYYDPSGDPRRPDFYSDIRERLIPDWDKVATDAALLSELTNRLEGPAGGARWKLAADLSAEQLDLYRRRYEASVRYLDSKMEELLQLLEERGVLENSVVFITSDHGESFGEGGFVTHNFNNQGDPQATRGVPLLVLPQLKTLEGPRIVSEPVSIADIKVTIDELLGIRFEADRSGPLYGRSLVEHFEEYTAPPREPSVMEFVREPAASSSEPLKERLQTLGYAN